MLVGIILGPHVLDIAGIGSMSNVEVIVEEVSRLVIAIQLMAIALKYDYLLFVIQTYMLIIFVVFHSII